MYIFFGYKVFEKPYLKLYPLVGFGFDAMMVTYFGKDLPPQDFDLYLNNPTGNVVLLNILVL